MRFSLRALVVAGLLAFVSHAGAQDALSQNLATGTSEAKILLADDALQLGLTELAEMFAQDALKTSVKEESRSRVALILATAQMNHGKLADARKTLEKCEDCPEKSLRLAMLNLLERGDWREALSDLQLFVPADLSRNDLPWFYLTRAVAQANAGDLAAMKKDFAQAIALAVSSTQQTHFKYYQLRSELLYCKNFVDEKALANLREEVMRSRGTSEAANFARIYIEALAVAGKYDEARKAFSLLEEIPKSERVNFDLLEALVQDSPGTVEAQQAFMKVIRARPDRETQGIAFTGLWLGVMMNAQSGRDELAKSLAANIENFLSNNSQVLPAGKLLPPDSRVADWELITRMRIAVELGETLKAEHLARELDLNYSSSPFETDALQFLVASAYQQGNYLKLTHYFERLIVLSKDDPEKQLVYQVALADCYAKVGDYSRAASFYTEASKNVRNDPALSALLMFQRVFAYVRDNDFAQAIMLLDLPSKEKETPEMRAWRMRAECVLISALRDSGRLEQALARSKTFLANRDVMVDFRIRALWLQTLIVVELKLPDLIKKTTGEMIEILNNLSAGTSATIVNQRETILAWAQLQLFRGYLLAGEEKDAFEQLKKMRENYKNSVPVIISYIDEARYYAGKAQHVEALRAYENLIALTAGHATLQHYATIAYFEAAQQNIALGRERDAANNYEQLVKLYPESPLVFYARSRQADLLRTQNAFDAALAIYDALINDFSNHNDIHSVEISRADCLLAIASESRVAGTPLREQLAKIDRAIAAYERLYSLTNADCALMAEAGNKWAYALLQKATLLAGTEKIDAARLTQDAKKLYWNVADSVIRKASANGQKDPAEALGTSGGYWVARSLFNLALEYEKEQNFESARDTYEVIILWAGGGWIPGQEYARTRLATIKGK